MSTSTQTVMISLDYHGSDEIITRHETMMTRMEMRALMLYMLKRHIRDFPCENCAIAFSKIAWMLRAVEHTICDMEEDAR